MTAGQIALVQDGWRSVLPVSAIFAELFYGKLFSLDASLQPLFKGDLREQGRNLSAMISIVVGALSRPRAIDRALHDLGRRHASYGVLPEHYALVETALLWALEQALGEAFTAEARDAWRATYAGLARAMQDACATT